MKSFLPIVLALVASRPARAQYAQITSSENQNLGNLGACTPIAFDADAVLSAFKYVDESNPTEVVVPDAGAYFIIAAPQVGFMAGGGGVADFWVTVNGEPVPNSNVRLQTQQSQQTKDVIVTQGIYELKSQDKVGICGSGDGGAFIEHIDGDGVEPGIPSIIVSFFKAVKA